MAALSSCSAENALTKFFVSWEYPSLAERTALFPFNVSVSALYGNCGEMGNELLRMSKIFISVALLSIPRAQAKLWTNFPSHLWDCFLWGCRSPWHLPGAPCEETRGSQCTASRCSCTQSLHGKKKARGPGNNKSRKSCGQRAQIHYVRN